MASKIQVDKIARASGTPEFTIPTADGTAKSALITDGSGVLSFATGTPSSSNFLRGDGTWQTVTTTALTGSTNTWIPTITAANALTGTANFTYDGSILDVKNSGTASSIKLYCESSNAHYQAIKAAPHAGSSDWTLTLPPTVPSVSGQALTATTAGVATWATVSGVLKKMHVFSMNTRTSGDAGAQANQLTITTSFIPLDPVNNDLWITCVIPSISIGNNFAGLGLRFDKSGDGEYDNFGKGINQIGHGMNTYQSGLTFAFNMAAGTIPAGTYTVYLRAETASSQEKIYNPNSTDDARISTQTSTHLSIMEWKN